MQIVICTVTDRGKALGEAIARGLPSHEVSFAGVNDLVFDAFDALVYVCAVGIAVRKLAPYVKSKLSDPAVVVCDEAGRFAVSLLSGHIGGANALTEEIAAVTGALPVVTTASDALEFTKEPKNIVLGIGCRRGTSAECIERAVTIALYKQNIPPARVCGAATIDIKRDEAGLIDFARAHKLPLSFFTAAELADVPGEFTASERVLSVTGVDNVCERSAVLLGGQGRLILPKTSRDGITVAVFERDGI